MKALTGALGETPEYQGWLALGKDARSYGFVFNNGSTPVLALWMPAGMSDSSITFSGNVKVTDSITGETVPLENGKALEITDKPVFVSGIPADLAAKARANAKGNFPWGGDYSKATAVSLQAGPTPVSNGVRMQGKREPYAFPDGTTGITVQGNIGSTANFYTHPSFADLKTREYYIRVSFRRLTAGNVGMNFKYEVADSEGKGPLRNTGSWFSLPADMGWQTHTWHVTDACFAKMWGFDFCLAPEQSVPFVVGKVEVSTKAFAE
jgi:hypothetical protein